MRMGELAMVGEPGALDAFHVPSVLVRSDGTLRPGDSVRFVDDPPTRAQVCPVTERHGVVDALIKGPIPAGGLVWVAVDTAFVVGVLTHQFKLALPKPVTPGTSPAHPAADRPDWLVPPLVPTQPVVPPAPAPLPVSPCVEPLKTAPTAVDDAYSYGDDGEADCNNRPPCV